MMKIRGMVLFRKKTTVILLCLCFSHIILGSIREKELTEMSFEELMNIEITLATRRENKLMEVPAAVYVLTQEDIQRSGFRTVPDLLRLVPGFEVARIDASKWAISARGFNNFFANKLLVLVDGRSAYSPVFSGVLWEVQDMLLEDIERIEVIRGPGATLWGSNAVTGVINIITKSSRETHGLYAETGGGTEEKVFGGVRFGKQLGDRFHFRVHAKYSNRDEALSGTDYPAADAWYLFNSGFRMDWNAGQNEQFTIHGNMYRGDMNQTLELPYISRPILDYVTKEYGGNILGRWKHTVSERSEMILQTYYDYVNRNDEILLGGSYYTVDIDFQHQLVLRNNRHRIIWGAGYRLTSDNIQNSELAYFDPAKDSYMLFSLFIQDEISLIDHRLHLILGSKMEHNDFTGFEFQPNIRMNWRINPNHSIWTAVSKAVRMPSRSDRDIYNLVARGNPSFRSEELYAFEIGDRFRPKNWIYLDGTVFYNRYHDALTIEGTVFGNKKEANAFGCEIGMDLVLKPWWEMRLGYSFFSLDVLPNPESIDTRRENTEGDSPRNQAFLHSFVNLPWNCDLDVVLRYVDSLTNPINSVPAYTDIDVRFAWHPTRSVEIMLAGQNLVQKSHDEFTATWVPFMSTRIQRAVYGKVAISL